MICKICEFFKCECGIISHVSARKTACKCGKPTDEWLTLNYIKLTDEEAINYYLEELRKLSENSGSKIYIIKNIIRADGGGIYFTATYPNLKEKHEVFYGGGDNYIHLYSKRLRMPYEYCDLDEYDSENYANKRYYLAKKVQLGGKITKTQQDEIDYYEEFFAECRSD